MKHTLPALPYQYNALEPYIDAKTMEIHHLKHHQGYIDKLNQVLEKYPDISNSTLENLLKNFPNLNMSEDDKRILKNNGGGHLNHSLFWNIMGPKKEINQALIDEIAKEFGSIDEFKKLFAQTALTHFGSGWAWLAIDNAGKLKIYSLPNQDSPIMSPPHLNGHTPIIGLDIWEHAYYLKYQNRRAEYIENWWHVLKLL